MYKPEKVKKVSKDRYEIQEKSCCGTSKKDKSNFEKLLYRAALKQGYSERTTVYYLADGDRKLWELKELLFPNAYGILDWFHITKRITLIDNLIEEAMSKYLEKIKAFLWHGKIDKALRMIAKFPYDKLQKHKNTISKKLNELKIILRQIGNICRITMNVERQIVPYQVLSLNLQ